MSQPAYMKPEHYDFVVIGGGSAGYAAARTARETKERVAIVDAAEELGGLCILRGCMPSKTLIYSTEILHLAHNAQKFGLSIPEAVVDWPSLHNRKEAMVDDFKLYRQEQLKSDRFTLIRERAVFVDKTTIELQPSGKCITADAFLIATGSIPAQPKIRGLAESNPWTSDDVLDLSDAPESVIVLGGGVVACELAQFLHRAGTKVIQIQRSERLIKEASPESSVVVEQVFRDEGIELYVGTKIHCIEKTEDGYRVEFIQGERSITVNAKHLLNALGRRPATGGLGLNEAGVTTAPSGNILTNAHQQTSNPRIYAAGDVSGPHEIVHVAILQGETAARHATGRPAQPVRYEHLTSVIFTDPQIASVGLTVDEINKQYADCRVADYPFEDHGKSILMEARYGYVKVWAECVSGRILRAECVGKDAGELIHAMAVAVTLNARAMDLLKVHWYHPTLSEIWTYPLEEVAVVDKIEESAT